LTLSLTSSALPQDTSCAPPSKQQLIIYRAGSLTRAFQPLEKTFTCQTGVQVKDMSMGSVDAGRQITAGGQACDL
jgi:ABC-type molybdate transport system substrate-binding protein